MQQQHPQESQIGADEHILVVDDDFTLCQTIQIVLQEEGFSVETAMDGIEALERVEREQPAIMLLDMGLPLLDGEGVAKKLHEQYGQAVPIVLMTADGHFAEKGRRIGAVAALNKPFEIDELLHVVYEALSAQERRGDNT